jgi:hypothetical protein
LQEAAIGEMGELEGRRDGYRAAVKKRQKKKK